jgi:putative lipoic acid-binding regulatory protein
MSPESSKPKVDFEKLRELLEKEPYPHEYTFKFIGKNSHRFTQGLHELEGKFKKLSVRGSRESSGGQNLAVTYMLVALNADEIIAVLEDVTQVDDLLVIL